MVINTVTSAAVSSRRCLLYLLTAQVRAAAEVSAVHLEPDRSELVAER